MATGRVFDINLRENPLNQFTFIVYTVIAKRTTIAHAAAGTFADFFKTLYVDK